ncbi:hypothetical protein [Streptomyces sp. NPDC054771]
MANGVWHTGYGIEINLSLPDLGHPGRPDLLREITARVAERDPQLLECKDRTVSLIDRAPWARVDDMPWKDIVGGKEMVIRGEYRYLQVWKCVPSSDRHCLLSDGAGHCGGVHSDWFVPALCEPERKAVHLEDLVLESATGESACRSTSPTAAAAGPEGTCGCRRLTASGGGS